MFGKEDEEVVVVMRYNFIYCMKWTFRKRRREKRSQELGRGEKKGTCVCGGAWGVGGWGWGGGSDRETR